MEEYKREQAFIDDISKKSDAFFGAVGKSSIRVLSHLDADGLSSAAIATKVLSAVGQPFSLSIIPTIDTDSLKRYVNDNDKHLIVLDLGSGQLNLLTKLLPDRNILILDHHEIEEIEERGLRQGASAGGPQTGALFHVNPRQQGIDGNMEVSGAGVAYYWARHMLDADVAVKLSRLALVGALGDIQENAGFTGLNNTIFEHAKKAGIIEQRQGVRWFGEQNKPLVNLLVNSDIAIPGVSTTTGAERLLTELGISMTIGEIPVKMCDLTSAEREKLISAIIQRRSSLDKPDDIFWNNYLFKGEKDGTIMRDGREIATLLNACGRLNKASVGLGLLLGDQRCRELASVVGDAYKKKIIEALKWYRMNKKSEWIRHEENVIIIQAKDQIQGTMIGTLASIISKEKSMEPGTFVVSLAHIENGKTKVSIRVAHDAGTRGLHEVARQLVERVGKGQAGGHANAAGAVIDRDVEDKFVEEALALLVKETVASQV